MQPIELLYILSSTVAIASSAPQILQLLRTKKSEELSRATWSMWLTTQFFNLAYMTHLGNPLLIAFSPAWLSFYVIIMTLIIRYRRTPVPQMVEVVNET